MSLIWIHEDAITLGHPFIDAAGKDAESIFIWDTAHHDKQNYSLKRRIFIYECALDLGVPIYAGRPQTVLCALSEGKTIFTAASPDPYVHTVIADLRKTQEVTVVDALAFAHVPEDVDTARFFRYWNKAKKTAMRRTHSVPIQESLF